MFAKGYIAGNIKTKGIKMRFSLIKREPSFFFENMHEDLQRFLKDTFGDIEPTSSNKPFERTFRPAVEIKETKELDFAFMNRLLKSANSNKINTDTEV